MTRSQVVADSGRSRGPKLKIDSLLARIDCLPPAPQILPPLLTLLARSDTDLSQVVDLVAFDPGLTATLMRTCNSAYFAQSTAPSNVSEAIYLLGFQKVYRLVAVVAASQCLRPAQATGLDPERLWRHSVITAFAAQFVAEDVQADSGLLFTAGMLHDIGRVILALAHKRAGSHTSGIIQGLLNGLSCEQEQAVFGTDHAEAGALLLKRWNFSPQLIASVHFHHTPAMAGEAVPLAACIALADSVAHALNDREADDPLADLNSHPALGLLSLPQEAPSRYRERLRENAEFVEGMCRLQT